MSLSERIDYKFGENRYYSSNHWIYEKCFLTDPKMIGIVYFKEFDYAIYLNPNDKRGYRSIIRLIKNDDMNSTLNRFYSSFERIGLSLTMSLVTDAYYQIVPIVQSVVAGNNAHSFDQETNLIELGNADEPNFLHGHVFGRGNPKRNYIGNVPLEGPFPGSNFDLKGELANEKKIPWKFEDMVQVVQKSKEEIDQLKNIYENFGLRIFTENLSFEIYLIRHGETDWNIEKKLQGHTDIPLNQNGLLQSEKLKEKLNGINFSKIISSDLQRAHSTAQRIDNSNQLIEKSILLREKSFGQWEGKSIEELHSYLKQTFDLDQFTKEEYLSFKWNEDIESYSDVYRRIYQVIRSLIISHSSDLNNPVLFSTHGGVLRTILYHFDYQQGFRWKVSNCALIKLQVCVDGQISIKQLDGIQLIKDEHVLSSF
ncbi:unnamed protein product [Adineta ricciae]|uniref:Fructose-2,6-bisphosphatase TIGAR n=1 Tax=Adineta ricciae TaxID=249248 RepID=A0A814YQE0_ADIRI|nr:unnamed protein product [Adineta ricciae]